MNVAVAEEFKDLIKIVPSDFAYKARCPTCDTILLWFDPTSGFGTRILTALCKECGVFYQIHIEKKWVGSDPCDKCLNCACCCIEAERWLRTF